LVAAERIARSGAGNDEKLGWWGCHGLTVASSLVAAKRIARSGAGNDEKEGRAAGNDEKKERGGQ
jgi:hypothetical protein